MFTAHDPSEHFVGYSSGQELLVGHLLGSVKHLPSQHLNWLSLHICKIHSLSLFLQEPSGHFMRPKSQV